MQKMIYKYVNEKDNFSFVYQIKKQLKKYGKSMKRKESGNRKIRFKMFHWNNHDEEL
jgi:hypothetical protein